MSRILGSLVVLAVFGLTACSEEPGIPFPEALDTAAISVSESEFSTRAVPIIPGTFIDSLISLCSFRLHVLTYLVSSVTFLLTRLVAHALS